tara:strand:+ start:1742 stop:2248 length:507 start_codon:yes stop_codon:yes gene_type:complete
MKNSPKIINRNFRSVKISDSLKGVNRKFLNKFGKIEYTIHSKWSEIVGSLFYEYSEPKKIVSYSDSNNLSDKIDYLKVLHVDVSPSICVEFQHFKNKIIEKINSYFGYEAVKEIKIRQKFIKREVVNKSVIKNYNNNELTKEILKTKIKDENLKKSVVNLGLSIKNTK